MNFTTQTLGECAGSPCCKPASFPAVWEAEYICWLTCIKLFNQPTTVFSDVKLVQDAQCSQECYLEWFLVILNSWMEGINFLLSWLVQLSSFLPHTLVNIWSLRFKEKILTGNTARLKIRMQPKPLQSFWCRRYCIRNWLDNNQSPSVPNALPSASKQASRRFQHEKLQYCNEVCAKCPPTNNLAALSQPVLTSEGNLKVLVLFSGTPHSLPHKGSAIRTGLERQGRDWSCLRWLPQQCISLHIYKPYPKYKVSDNNSHS